MFERFKQSLNDDITVCKQNGMKTEKIKAAVRSGQIFIDVASNQNLPQIETGDIIEHKQTNGVPEQYKVIDPGYFDIPPMGAHYRCKVSKLSTLEQPSSISTTYNVTAGQANFASDNATITAKQTVRIKQSSDIEELFRLLLAVVNDNAFENQEAIISAISEMKQTVGKPSIGEKYNAFIQSVANHMTIFSPFIPQLTMLLLESGG
jgi:hypothetical protein